MNRTKTEVKTVRMSQQAIPTSPALRPAFLNNFRSDSESLKFQRAHSILDSADRNADVEAVRGIDIQIRLGYRAKCGNEGAIGGTVAMFRSDTDHDLDVSIERTVHYRFYRASGLGGEGRSNIEYDIDTLTHISLAACLMAGTLAACSGPDDSMRTSTDTVRQETVDTPPSNSGQSGAGESTDLRDLKLSARVEIDEGFVHAELGLENLSDVTWTGSIHPCWERLRFYHAGGRQRPIAWEYDDGERPRETPVPTCFDVLVPIRLPPGAVQWVSLSAPRIYRGPAPGRYQPGFFVRFLEPDSVVGPIFADELDWRPPV